MRSLLLILIVLCIPLSFVMAAPIPPDTSIEIVIDPGHGGVDSGATYAEIEEKQVNLAVAQKMVDALEQRGYQVILTRERDEALSETSPRKEIGSRHRRDLVQRGDIINYFTPQLILSLHVNSGSSTKRGGLVLYQANGQGYLLAHILQDKLNHIANSHESPLKNRSLYILNRTKAIALVVELGYLSNPHDRELLLNPAYQDALSRAIVDGIDEFMLCFPWSITAQ